MSVVQPAYHCLPNGGQGSFFPSGNRRLSCVRVFATIHRGSDVRRWGRYWTRYIRRDMLLLQLELVAVRHEVMCVYNTYFYCSCRCAGNNRAQGAGLSCISRSVRHKSGVQVVCTFFFSVVAAIIGKHQRVLPAERSSKKGLEDAGCRVLPLQSLLEWRRGLVGLHKGPEYEVQRRAITSPVVILWARRIETCCPRNCAGR